MAEMYFSGTPIPSLPTADRLHILDTLADGGVTDVSVLGGEPLVIRRDLERILARAAELGLRVTVVTNGTLLDKFAARMLIRNKLYKLVVSIEGPEASVHDRIRGAGAFERTMRNLDEFLAMRGNTAAPHVGVNTVLSRVNRASFAQMVPFCRDLGADTWTAVTLNFVGNARVNLAGLALSDEEHTDVALEIGRLLSSPGFDCGKLEVNLAIIYPLVWEYLCTRYGVRLPKPVICCSASTSLVYVSPTGDLHLCDRVNNGGYTGRRLKEETIHPVSLLDQSFESVWKSRQFVEMYDFINQPDTYRGYRPCRTCPYLSDRSCTPCPLYSLDGESMTFSECVKAQTYLRRVRRDSQSTRPRAMRVESLPGVEGRPTWDRVRQAHPNRVPGVRHSLQPDGTAMFMQPDTGRSIAVNLTGEIVWDLIDGLRTSDEVVSAAIQACTDACGRVSRATPSQGTPKELDVVELAQMTREFVVSLSELRFVQFADLGT